MISDHERPLDLQVPHRTDIMISRSDITRVSYDELPVRAPLISELSYITTVFYLGMKGWSVVNSAESTVELQSIKGEELIDVLEQFAFQTQIDPIPLINMSSAILKVGRRIILLSDWLITSHVT